MEPLNPDRRDYFRIDLGQEDVTQHSIAHRGEGKNMTMRRKLRNREVLDEVK